MNKIIKFLKESNHLAHFAAGIIIGLISFNLWTAILASSCAAGAAEAKDRIYSNKWDWVDFLVTVGGGLIGFGVYSLISIIL